MGKARGKSRAGLRRQAKREEAAAHEGKHAATPTLMGPLRGRGARKEYVGARWMGETIRKGDVVLLQAPKGELSYVALISALFQPSADPDAEPQALCRWFYRFEDMPAAARSAVNFSRNKRLLAMHLWLTDCEDANPVSSILEVVGCKPIVDMHEKAIGKTLESDNHLGFWCAQQFDVRTRRTSTLTNTVFLELRNAWLRSQPEVHRALAPDAADGDGSASDCSDAPASRLRKRLRSGAASRGPTPASRSRRTGHSRSRDRQPDGAASTRANGDRFLDSSGGHHDGDNAPDSQASHSGLSGAVEAAGARWPTPGAGPIWLAGLPPTHLLPPPPPGMSPVVSIPASHANLGSPPLAAAGQHYFLPPGFFPSLVPSLPLAQAPGRAPGGNANGVTSTSTAAAAGAALGAGWGRPAICASPVRMQSSAERARTQVARPHTGAPAASRKPRARDAPSASGRGASRGRVSRRQAASSPSTASAQSDDADKTGCEGGGGNEEATESDAVKVPTRSRANPPRKRTRTASAAVSAVVIAATGGPGIQSKANTGRGGAAAGVAEPGGAAPPSPCKPEPSNGRSSESKASEESEESDGSGSDTEGSSSSRPLRFCSRVGAEFQATHLPPVRPKPLAKQTLKQEQQEQQRPQQQGGKSSCLWRAGTASREVVARYLSRLRAMAVGWRGTNVLHTDPCCEWEGQRAVVCTNDAEDEAEVSSDIVVRPRGSAQPQRVECSRLHACIRVDLALRLLYDAGGDVKAALPRVTEHRLLLQRREDTMSTTAKAWTRAERERLLRHVAYWVDGCAPPPPAWGSDASSACQLTLFRAPPFPSRVRWQRAKFHQAARMLKRRPGDVMAWYYANKKVPLSPQERAEAERAGVAAERRLTRREATFMAARAKKQQSEPRADSWSCPRCTFTNTQARRLCALCHTPRWVRRTASAAAAKTEGVKEAPQAPTSPAAGVEATLAALRREGREPLGTCLHGILQPLLEPAGGAPDEVDVRRLLLDVADACCAVPGGEVVLRRVARALD